jgi:hypothetical protein
MYDFDKCSVAYNWCCHNMSLLDVDLGNGSCRVIHACTCCCYTICWPHTDTKAASATMCLAAPVLMPGLWNACRHWRTHWCSW